ncbi:methyltransferase [Candidatus Dojkabacteria bacterium]|nr:methyltransferase [Candidatus Dojkabacteria bacterium]
MLNDREVKLPQDLPSGTQIRYKIGASEIYIETHREVWTPSEFTINMCKLLDSENLKNKVVMDFACGSGILGILAAKKGAKSVIFSDINQRALDMTKRNWKLNNLPMRRMKTIRSDCYEYFHQIDRRLKVDVIVSNPPTAPENLTTKRQKKLAAQWNENGEDARKVTDALIKESGDFLNENGILLFVTTNKQGPIRTSKLLNKHFGKGLQKNNQVDPLDYMDTDNGKYNWKVIKRLRLLLDEWYFPFIEKYKNIAILRNEPSPILRNEEGELIQLLYFIKANKY